MKKKTWVVLIYCIVIVLGLVAFLVFFPKNTNEEPKNPSNDSTTTSPDNPSSAVPGPSVNPPEAEGYATKLTLNCARQVIVAIGSELELLSNYIIVEPLEMISYVAVEITPTNSAANDGLEFKNNKITPKSAGIYNVKFSVPASKTTVHKDTLVVTVVEANQDNKIEQKKFSSTINEVVSVNDLVIVHKDIDSVYISNSDFITFLNGTITGIRTGETILTIKLVDSYFSFNYSFNYTIKDIPEYYIEVVGEVNNVLELTCNVGDMKAIQFAVYDKNNEYVNQTSTAEIDDSNIARVKTIEEMVIYIDCVGKGSCKLIIKSSLPELEDKVITLILK